MESKLRLYRVSHWYTNDSGVPYCHGEKFYLADSLEKLHTILKQRKNIEFTGERWGKAYFGKQRVTMHIYISDVEVEILS